MRRYYHNLLDLIEELDDAIIDYNTGINRLALKEYAEYIMDNGTELDCLGCANVGRRHNAVLEFVVFFYHSVKPLDLERRTIALWRRIRKDFYYSDAPLIRNEDIEKVLASLEKIFPFEEKLIKDHSITICVLDNAMKGRNGESSAYCDEESVDGFIALYRMWNDFNGHFNPQLVLLHELGHQLHFYLTKRLDAVPESFIPYLKLIGANWEELSNDDLLEVFADTFLLAVVYKTKEFGDPFPDIDEDAKEFCYTYIKMLFDQLL